MPVQARLCVRKPDAVASPQRVLVTVGQFGDLYEPSADQPVCWGPRPASACVGRQSRIGGTRRVLRICFKAWGRSCDLQFIPEHEYITATKERRYIDGALLHDLRVPFGYWEAKDSADDLDEEIARKFRRGYPRTNIIFEAARAIIGIMARGKRLTRSGVSRH